MTIETSPPKKRSPRWQWLFISLIIPVSFACVFFSSQAALLNEPERIIAANFLPDSQVNYHHEASKLVVFAPLNPEVIIEATRDARGLQITLASPLSSNTPMVIAQLPATPTTSPQTTQVEIKPTQTVQASPTQPAPTRTPIPATETRIAPTHTELPPTLTNTWIPPTKTPVPPTSTQKPKQPTDTAIPPTLTSEPTIVIDPQTPTSTPTLPQLATEIPTQIFTDTPTSTSIDTPTLTYTPLPTNTPVYRNIRPFVNCATNNGDGSVTAYFGYSNQNSYQVSIPIGSNNGFMPSPINRGQPTLFTPGRHDYSFSVTFNENLWGLIWWVDGNFTAAWSGSPACP